MAWIRRRGNSFALIESYREGGKVKQRYLRTLTSTEAEALHTRSDPTPTPEPLPFSIGIAPAVVSHPQSTIDIHAIMVPTALLPVDTTPHRVPASPLTGRERCQMCDNRLPLGGVLCPKCTGALLVRAGSSVCERCQRVIRFGGWQQRFCCSGCLAGSSHTQGCSLGDV
jgi:hypothetical protein